MKRFAIKSAGQLLMLLACAAPCVSQSSSSEPAGNAPQIAFDITKADVDTVLKNMGPSIDQAIRVFDMGKYNLCIAVNHRGVTNDKPGDAIVGAYHTEISEVYVMLSGSGIFTTGGTTVDPKPSVGYSLAVGPSVNGTAGKGAFSRRLQAGDIVVIPPGVFHAWSQITEPVTYLSIRPDPDRATPAGFVSPYLLKNAPAASK